MCKFSSHPQSLALNFNLVFVCLNFSWYPWNRLDLVWLEINNYCLYNQTGQVCTNLFSVLMLIIFLSLVIISGGKKIKFLFHNAKHSNNPLEKSTLEIEHCRFHSFESETLVKILITENRNFAIEKLCIYIYTWTIVHVILQECNNLLLLLAL